MVGHALLIKTFKQLVEAGSLSHGYLFFGPEGVGKKLFAMSLANFLERREFDYDEKESRVFNDVVLIQPNENRTIGIDAVREIKNFLYQRPNVSSRRTVIIDEAEFLTTEAQNALLKITEEPPASSLLVLIAREPEILIPTLASRLQKVYFSSLKSSEVEEWLKSRNVERETWNVRDIEEVAEKSMGRPGLALRMLSNDKFKETRKLAETFLKVSGTERREFIKKLLEPEDFDILNFLDAIILAMTSQLRNTPILEIWKTKVSENPNFNTGQADDLRIYGSNALTWHKVLKLRQDFSNFPLNSKLQLTSLLANRV